MERARDDLNRAVVAVSVSWAGLLVAAGVMRLWLINTGQATPVTVFGWSRMLMLAPLALLFVIYQILDRRYLVPKADRAKGPNA